MLIKHFFYITWIDIEGASQDSIFLTIHNAKKAILVHACQIARMQPAIVEDLRSLFWPLPVSLHHPPRNPHFNAGGGAGKRQANTTHTPLTFDRVRMCDRRCLSQTVTLNKM